MPGAAVTQRVVPQLRVIDWKRSRAFYCDGLGFNVEWEHRFEPGFPVFAKLTLDGMSIFLTEHAGDCQVGGAAYFLVDDVDAFYQAVRSRGSTAVEQPEDTPWGTREITIVDPDGNRLRFGGTATTR
jgi:catechol 2,3-dioxygenase-like lactoylglutathione lyase family enzyme